MTMITLDNKITDDENLLGAARLAVTHLRQEISAFQQRLAGGEASSAAIPDVKRLYGLLQNCLDTESRLAKLREEQVGIAQNGIAFDLDEARSSIGRKLDRLRATQTAA